MDEPVPAVAEAQPAAAQQPAATADFDFSKADPAKIAQVFQDPRFLAQAANAYLSRGLPEGIKYLQHANTAAKENAFEALTRLEQGDGEGAIKAFNISGRFTNAKSAKNNGDGTWTLGDADGNERVINPVNLKKTLLSPQAYFAATEAERRTGILQQEADSKERDRVDRRDAQATQNTNQDAYWRRVTDNRDRETELRGETAMARIDGASAAARARAEGSAKAAEARAEADLAKAEMNNKYGPMADRSAAIKAANDAGKTPEEARRAGDMALADHPDVIAVTGKSGAVGIFPAGSLNEKGQPTGRPLRTFQTAAEYESLTGRKMPKSGVAAPVEAPKAAPATAAPKPRTIGLSDVYDEREKAKTAETQARRLKAREDDEEYLRNSGPQY